MRINGKDYRAVWWEDSAIRFIDQRRLPCKFEVACAKTVNEAARAIVDMGGTGRSDYWRHGCLCTGHGRSE